MSEQVTCHEWTGTNWLVRCDDRQMLKPDDWTTCPTCGVGLGERGEVRERVDKVTSEAVRKTQLWNQMDALATAHNDGRKLRHVDLQALRDLGLYALVGGQWRPTNDFAVLHAALSQAAGRAEADGRVWHCDRCNQRKASGTWYMKSIHGTFLWSCADCGPWGDE